MYSIYFKIYEKSEEVSVIICLRQSVQEEKESSTIEKPNVFLWTELQYASVCNFSTVQGGCFLGEIGNSYMI